ncbi:MAG: glycosyltransferase family 2 protein [Microgenomates group bacterium]
MNKITVLIQTHNEERHIEECIASAKLLSDSVVVVDMESTDRTRELAESNGAIVTTFPFSSYVEPGRAFGIAQIKSEWVFILDADERMTEKLASEIRKTIIETDKTYFKVPRKNMFGGKKWLKHGGWWPDKQMRLIKLSAFKNWPHEIHSTPQIDGEMGYLKNAFHHYFHGNLEEMVKKTLIFENIESDLLFHAKKQVSVPTFFRKFFGELYRRLFKKQGYLDGKIGIMESVYQSYSKTITYLLLYEKKNRRSVHPLS